ncbi:hypothetical protein CFP56_017408 [Quercus suber]|uniref:Uncharacterized protein n=1 Tax=Quercus suber TaxID=58331 RepID=A0AAW0KMA6_QUESU
MAATNAGRIDHMHPNPIDVSVLKLQPTYWSKAIWNGIQGPLPAIPVIEGYLRLLSHHPVGTEDLKDITDVLNAVQEIGRVRPPDPEAPNEDVATLAATPTQRPSTTKSPSTSTAPTGRPPVATPQVVPTPDPSPSTHIHPLAHHPFTHPTSIP